MTSDNVRTASDTIAREASELTSSLVKELGLGGGDAVSGIINQDMICMVFGLHYSANDNFAHDTGTDGMAKEVFAYYCEASGAPEGSDAVLSMRDQIMFYASSGLDRNGMIADTVNRLNWYFQKGSVPAYGVKATELPKITDLNTALGAIENILRNSLPAITSKVLGWNEATLTEGAVGAEPVGYSDFTLSENSTEVSDDEPEEAHFELTAEDYEEDGKEAEEESEGNIPFVQRPHIDQEYAEREAMRDQEENGKALGMRFHMFWVQFGLPLTVMMAGMDALMGIFSVVQGNFGAITNTLIRAGVLLFGIPALKGLRKFTKKAFLKNSTLIFYSMGVKIINIIMVGMNFYAAPTYVNQVFSAAAETFTEQGVTQAMLLGDLHMQLYISLGVTIVTAIFWSCLFVYYKKRRKYFKY